MSYKRKQGDKRRDKTNPVAKHAHGAGAIAKTHRDRKQCLKLGYIKHKGELI